MNRKLNSILLIDDDEPTNFINKMAIKKLDITNEIIVYEDANEALEFLKTRNESDQYPSPELMFLDINMPGMNGWEFLEKYKQLNENQKAKIIVIMLTTSLNPDDEKRARAINEITDFKSKPLNKGVIEDIISKYFPTKTN